MQTVMAAPSLDTATRPVSAGTIGISASEEETLLKIDLSGLELPRVNNLQVDGLQRSWWARLFGK